MNDLSLHRQTHSGQKRSLTSCGDWSFERTLHIDNREPYFPTMNDGSSGDDRGYLSMAAVLRGFTIGLCWAVVGIGVLAWMITIGPLAGLMFLCLVAAALFIVVAPFVHVGIYYVRGSHSLAAVCTGFGILGVLVVLTMTGMFNFP